MFIEREVICGYAGETNPVEGCKVGGCKVDGCGAIGSNEPPGNGLCNVFGNVVLGSVLVGMLLDGW